MRPSQRSRSRSRASQRSAEAGDTQPQASKAPSGDGELQAGPQPTGSRPRWRQGTLPEAPGAAPEDSPHKHEDTQEPEDKKGATQPEREDTQQEPQTEREDKGGATQQEREDTQEKPEDPQEAPETEPEDSAELRAWQSPSRRAAGSLQAHWELESQL